MKSYKVKFPTDLPLAIHFLLVRCIFSIHFDIGARNNYEFAISSSIFSSFMKERVAPNDKVDFGHKLKLLFCLLLMVLWFPLAFTSRKFPALIFILSSSPLDINAITNPPSPRSNLFQHLLIFSHLFIFSTLFKAFQPLILPREGTKSLSPFCLWHCLVCINGPKTRQGN